MTTAETSSAAGRLDQLLERLLTAAEASLAAGELEPARATAEEVRAVDPDNPRAAGILDRIGRLQRGPAGERALMTLLFSDLVGSTALSERVEPEQVRDLFARYRSEAGAAVERFGGNVIQYSGDGVLAGFGYPQAHEDDARRAVLAGLDLVSGMRAAGSDLTARFGVALQVRVGVHTGRVVVTEFDRSVRERDSIVGVTPNLAARVQQVAPPDAVVISDVTRQLVDADFYVRSLGLQDLRGISRPVEVFVVDGPRYAGARLEADRYRRAEMVGRDEPKNRLAAAWQRVRGSTEADAPGEMTLVAGEAGIGKTRLVADVRDMVIESGGGVISAGCLPYYANVSLWPVAQMLRRNILSADGEAPGALGRLVEDLEGRGIDPAHSVPFLAPLMGIAEPEGFPTPELDPSAFLDITFDRIVDWIEATGRTIPTLLIVEDLHWADPSTLALLGRVASRRPARILTVTTTRHPEAVPWRDSVGVIGLPRLDEDSSESLVSLLAEGREITEALRHSIVTRAQGIPLFLEELTRSCLDADSVEPLPFRLQELLTGRLKAADLDLRVAQVAATIGPSFDAGTVAALIADEAHTEAQLALLEENGLIDRGEAGSDSYRFRHALLRDAAYETQVLEVRSQTHERLADLLLKQGAAAALIAEHLVLAGRSDRAVPQFLTAAQEAQARGAHTEATRLLSGALDLVEAFPDSDERDLTELTGRMLRGLSVSSMQGYAAPDVQQDHRRAEVLAARLGTRPEVLPSLIAIWAYWLTSGDLETAAGLIERLSAMVDDPAFAWFGPEVASCAGWQALYRGELDVARARLEEAVTGFEARAPEELVSPFWPLPNDPYVVSEIALACVLAVTGDLAGSAEWEQAALRRAGEIGFPRGPFSQGFVLTYAAWIRRFLGDDAAARELGTRVVEIGQEYGYAYWVMLGLSYVPGPGADGEPDPASLEQTIGTLRMMGQQAFLASNLAYLGRMFAHTGDRERALESVEEALQVIHKTGELIHLPEVLRLRGSYQLDRGSIDDAVEDLVEALSVATSQGAHVSRLRAALAIAALPPERRPESWRREVEEARRLAPQAAEAVEADRFLAG